MRIRAVLAFCALAAAALFSLPASAHQTISACNGSVHSINPIAANGTTAGYVDERELNSGGYTFSIWVYQESNGHPGEQSKAGNTSIADDTDVENCTNGIGLHGTVNVSTADTIVY